MRQKAKWYVEWKRRCSSYRKLSDKFFRIGLANIATLVFLSGCSSITLYNAERDQTASEAVVAFAALDFKVYAENRAARRSLLRDEHLAITSSEVLIAARDAMTELLSIPVGEGLLSGGSKPATLPHWLGQPSNNECSNKSGIVSQRLCSLGVADSEDLEVVNDAVEGSLLIYGLGVPAAQEDLQAIVGARAPTCEDLRFLQTDTRRAAFGETLIASVSKPKKVAAKAALNSMMASCSRAISTFDSLTERAMEKALQRKVTSRNDDCEALRQSEHRTEIAVALCDLFKLDNEVMSAKVAIAAVVAELKSTATKIAQAEAEARPFREVEFRAAILKATEKASEIVSGAAGAIDELGSRSGSNEVALGAISELLEAISTEEVGESGEDSIDLKRAKILFASFQSTTTKVGDVANALAEPVPAQLLIARDFLTIERDYQRERLAQFEAKRALENRLVSNGLGQAYILLQAGTAKDDVCSAGCVATPLFILSSGTSAERRATYTALAQVWLALTTLEEARRHAPWERTFLAHDQIALERNRAMAETQLLAGGGLADLAAFYKTGLKREEIVALTGRLANLALLGGILDATE